MGSEVTQRIHQTHIVISHSLFKFSRHRQLVGVASNFSNWYFVSPLLTYRQLIITVMEVIVTKIFKPQVIDSTILAASVLMTPSFSV